jgi:hypothetical protein
MAIQIQRQAARTLRPSTSLKAPAATQAAQRQKPEVRQADQFRSASAESARQRLLGADQRPAASSVRSVVQMGGTPEVAQAKLNGIASESASASSSSSAAGIQQLASPTTARNEQDARVAEELLTRQVSAANGVYDTYDGQDVAEALGPQSTLTQPQKDEYTRGLVTQYPNLLLRTPPGVYNGDLVHSPETARLLGDAIAQAHQSGVLSDEDLRKAADSFENPSEFALTLSLGDHTSEVGGPLDVLGQHYRAKAEAAGTSQEASNYQAAAALAFTSSQDLINKHLTTPEARVQAFSTVAQKINDAAIAAQYPTASALNAAYQNQYAENATRVFGSHGAEIAEQLATTSDGPFGASGATGDAVLSEFYSETLLSPRAESLQVDGQQARDLLEKGLHDGYTHLWDQATQLTASSGEQSAAFQKVGTFLGTLDTAAEVAERRDLQPAEDEAVLKLFADVVLSAIPFPTGTDPLVGAFVDDLLTPAPGQVDPSIERASDTVLQAYLDDVAQYENAHPETEAYNSVSNGLNKVGIEDQQDKDG